MIDTSGLSDDNSVKNVDVDAICDMYRYQASPLAANWILMSVAEVILLWKKKLSFRPLADYHSC